MASFNLTAEINLRGPSNIKKVVGDIQRQLNNIQSNVNLKISDKAAKNLDSITSSVNVLNDALMRAQTSANGLSSTLGSMGVATGNVSKNLNSVSQSVSQVVTTTETVAKSVSKASSEMAEFGRQSALAVRRFAAFSVATGAIYGLTRAFSNAYSEFVQFDRELIRLKQTTGSFGQDIDSISNEVTRLSTSLGVSSSDLLKVSVTLAQAGLSANETKNALEALAKTTLSPSFEDITQTTEGAIAALRQFGLQTKDLESSLGSINAVAAAFAVESSDIISAIQRTGGVFASASKGVSEGTDALNEFIAVFTSVRATTRESAETIATGLRTIFTRIQRGSTIEALREYGVELTDLKGKFVGPYEAVRRLSEGLAGLDTRDIRFSKIIEELGGFRQIGKVIPLIQQFKTAQQALGIAQQGQTSLTTNAIQAQEALAVQFAKTREEFLGFVRSLGESDTFKNVIGLGLTLTRTLIQIAGAFKPILPYLAIIGGLRGGASLTQYVGGFMGGIKKSSKNSAKEEDLLGSLFGSSKQRESSDSSVTNRLEGLLADNSSALSNVTSALDSLNRTLSTKGQTLNRGGKVMAFAGGGYVPGSGNRDTVPAMLMPGEFVIRKKAVETIGAGNLNKMNKYASGGKVKDLTGIKPDLKRYYDTEDDRDIYSGINIDRPSGETSFKQSREQYRERAEKIWQQASAIFAQSKDLEEANSYIRRKTRIDPGSYDAKELDPSNTAPQRLNRIQGALTEQTVRRQTTGLTKLPNAAGADFAYASSGGTQFVEVKNKLEKTEDSDLISKALLGYAYINSSSPEFFKNNQLDKISGLNIELRSTNPLDIQSKNFGGMIQKFMAGGVAELAQQKQKSVTEILLEQIEALGKAGGVKRTLGLPPGDRRLNSLLLPGNIKAGKNIDEAIKIINQALEARGTTDAAQEEAIAQATKFGLVGLLPFDYSKQFGPENIGGRSTYIIARGMSSKYQDIVENMQQELSGVSAKYAEQIQMRNIFGGAGPLVFDFDETLVDRSEDLMRLPDGSINIAGFSDAELVKKDLRNTTLTPLGQELKKRIDTGALSLDDVRVVTARPQSNAPYLAEALGRLGLNIPENKITGTSGPENKINNVTELETLIDDRLATIQQFKKAGRSAIAYAPVLSDLGGPAIAAGQAALEGASIEKILASLGAPLRSDAEPGRPIDYPDGLGIAADYFGIDPNMPTEVKRTIDGSSLARTRGEIERYYNENIGQFAVGGEVEAARARGVKQGLLKKYRDILKSILPPDFLTEEGYLKTPSGRAEPIEIVPPEDPAAKSKRSMMDILLGRATPNIGGGGRGASYSGGLVYKFMRENLYAAKDSLPEKEYKTLKSFVDQNLMFEGEDDIINLEGQKRAGSLAHETFHDIQGYLLDYYPEIYKRLQQGVNNQRKSIEKWYSDPSTEQWRTSRDYQLKHIFPEKSTDSPYSDTILQKAIDTTQKINKEKFMSQGFWDKVYPETMKDLGRAEAIPVLLAAAAENNAGAQKILSDIFGSAGLNRTFYESMPKYAQGGVATEEKKAKQYGKIALRQDGSSISATYFKNDTRSGQVSAYKLRDYLYYVGLSAATGGYGPRLYDTVMEAATQQGAMLTSDRSSVSGSAKKVWEYYFKNRADVKKTPLDFQDWTKNNSLIDPKLYGKKETWPPYTDPAWVLQTGYSKSPSLINDPASVVNMDKQAQSSASMALQYFGAKTQGFANGGSAQDTVPAMLTPGEFVINKKAAQKIGYGQLHKLNKADKIQGFNKGGSVGVQRFAAGGKAAGDYAASVERFVEQLVKLTQSIEQQQYRIERAAGKSIPEAKQTADMMAQTGAIDFGRTQVYLHPSSSQAISDAVGRVLDSYVTKISPFVEGGKRRSGYEIEKAQPIPNPQPPVNITGSRATRGMFDPNDFLTLTNTVEKFSLMAAASDKTLEQLTDEIRQFTTNTAISYKQLVSQRQKTVRASIARATDVRTDESKQVVAKQISDLFEAYGTSIKPERLQEIIEKTLSNIDKGLEIGAITKSIPELNKILSTVISNNEALAYAIDKTVTKFGTLTDAMTADELDIRAEESVRGGRFGRGNARALQAASEANPFWEKLGGNKFPGFDALNKISPELAEKLGTVTEKAGGFIAILGAGSAVLGNTLPKLYQGIDSFAGSSLALSSSAQGAAKALNQAGNDAIGMAKLAQEAGLGARGTGVAASVGLVTGAIKGFSEGFITQNIENTNAKIADSQEKIANLLTQLSTPGLERDAQLEIRENMLDEIMNLTNQFGSVIENTTGYWSTSVTNLADSALYAANTFLSVAATLALIKLGGGILGKQKGGVVGYYGSGGSIFKPKGTDTVPAMLTPGEFVVNAKSSKKNRGILEDINSGRYMARGGVVYAAGGNFIQSDKQAGRASTGYIGTLSDFYNPFDEDFYKSSNDATEAVLKFGGRLAAVTAIISGAAAAVLSFGPAVGGFFTKTLPGLFSAGFTKVSSVASGAWGKITGIFGKVKVAAALPGTSSQVVGAGGAVAAGASAAAGGSVLSKLLVAQMALQIGSAVVSGFTRWWSGSSLNKEQQQNLLAQGQILDKLIEYAKISEAQTISLQELNKIFLESRGLVGEERNRAFAKASPVVSAAQRGALRSQGFDIGVKDNLDTFIAGLDAAQQERARTIIDETKLEQARQTLIADEKKRLVGRPEEEVSARIQTLLQPLEGFKTFTEAQQAAQIQPKGDAANLLNRALNLQGITAQTILMEELFSRTAVKLNAETDNIVNTMKRLEQGLAKVADGMNNLQLGLPTALGNRLGGDIPSVRLDRSDLNVLRNVNVSSVAEIEAAVGRAGSQLGMTGVGTSFFTKQFKAQKVLETDLPRIINQIVAETATGTLQGETAVDRLQKDLSAALEGVVDPEYAKQLTALVSGKLTQDNRQGGGFERFTQDPNALGAITKGIFSSTDAFIKSSESLKSSIENLTQISDTYAGALSRISELSAQYARVSAESVINLKRTLGEKVSLEDLNKVFENELKIMTSGMMGRGTTDPGEIAKRLQGLETERQNILGELQARGGSNLRGLVERGITGEQFLKPEYASLAKRLGSVTSESNRLQQALNTLANNGQQAANVLNKIQELRKIDQAKEGNFMDLLKNLNNPEYFMELQKSARALSAVMAGEATRFDVPDAIKALEMRLTQLSPEDADQMRKEFVGKVLQIPGLEKLGQLFGPGGAFEGAFKGPNAEIAKLTGDYNELIKRQLEAINLLAQRTTEGGNIILQKMKEGADIWYNSVLRSVELENELRRQDATRRANQQLLQQQEAARAVAGPAAAKSKGGLIYASKGQFINFKPKGTDTVPAMLTPGEFVVNAKATKQNLGLLQSINGGDNGYSSGGIIYRQDGGSVGRKSKSWWSKPDGARDLYWDIVGSQPGAIDPAITSYNKDNPGKPKKADGSYWSAADFQKWADFINAANLQEYKQAEQQKMLLEQMRQKEMAEASARMIEADKNKLKPEDRSWLWTENRGWMDYFGIPENENEFWSALYGFGSKIIPGILGTIMAGAGFAVGAPLGPGATLTGAAGGYAGVKAGENINQFILDNLFPASLKTDIERKMKENPENYAAGQWIGFASELGAGFKYGPVIEQATRGGIRDILLKSGDETNAAAYRSLSHNELQLAAKRLEAETKQAIKSGQSASEKVTTIHGTPRVSDFEKPGIAMGEVIDPKHSKSPGYGPGMDTARPTQLGMHGHNVGINSIVDNIHYAQEGLQAIIKKVIQNKASYAELQAAMDDAGFLLSDISMAVMDNNIVRMMNNVSKDEPLFQAILKNLDDRGQTEILKNLGDGVDLKWYDVLNKFKSSFAEEAQFRNVAEGLGIKGTRASALEIRGGTIPPGSGTISGESVAVITNKILEDTRALRLKDLIRFKASFVENARQMGLIIDEAGRITVTEGAKHTLSGAEGHRLGGLIYASNGQLVNFKSRGTDTVPAMLTPGEFVVNRKATQNNLPLLQSINNGYYNKGGMVQYRQNGGPVNNGSSIDGVSNVSVDSSSLDAAFAAFGTHVNSMKQSIDNFGTIVGGLQNIGDGARTLSVAAASIRNASDNFGSNIRLLSTTLSSLEKSINDIPRSISLQVTGAIPVNVNVDINGGQGLETSLQPFKDTIYSEISKAISDATKGNIKIDLKTTKR